MHDKTALGQEEETRNEPDRSLVYDDDLALSTPRTMPKKTRQAPIALEQTTKADSHVTGSLAKSVDVLERIMASSQAPSAAELTDELKLPRPTTNRIIANLVNLGLLARDPKQRQLIEGERLLNLALNVLERAAQRGPRHQILRELSHQTRETTNVGIIAHGQIRYVDRVESQWPLSLRLEPGSTVPLHCTAIGKLLLGLMPVEQREKYLKTLKLTPFTPSTLTDPAALRAELDDISRCGFSLDREEYLSGVVGLAVPIPNGRSAPVLALAIAAPSARMTADELVGDLPLLRQAAEKLAKCY